MRLQRGHSIPAAQVRQSPAPAATEPSPTRLDHAARARLGSSPGDHRAVAVRLGGAGTKSLLAAAGGCRPVPKPDLRGLPAAAAPVLRGTGCSGGGAATGPEGFREWRRSGRLGRLHLPLPSRPLPITLPCGLLVTVAAANGLPSQGGAAKAD